MAVQFTEMQAVRNVKGRWRRHSRKSKDARLLRKHITETYTWLRFGMVAIAFMLPWVLWGVGQALFDQPLLGTMSAYYYSPMRDVFVGGLWAIGTFLILYKGYSDHEELALLIAGVSAILVALFPLDWQPAWFPTDAINPHGLCAMLLFLCISYVCWFCASDTLGLIRCRELKERYNRIYKALAIAIVAVPIATWIFVQVADLSLLRDTQLFWLETIGISIFGSFWAVKSYEIQNHTQAELRTFNLQAQLESDGLQPVPLETSIEALTTIAEELESSEQAATLEQGAAA